MGHLRCKQDNFRRRGLFTQVTADVLAKVDYHGGDAFLDDHVKPTDRNIISTFVWLFFGEMLDNKPRWGLSFTFTLIFRVTSGQISNNKRGLKQWD